MYWCVSLDISESLASNLLRRDLRVPVSILSQFNLSLPQCNVPGVLNCMLGRLSALADPEGWGLQLPLIFKKERSPARPL